MKRYRLMHILSLAVLLLAGVSCTNDLSEELQTPAAPLDGLAIGFDTGSNGFTRVDVASETALNEDLVDHVDVFIFDGTTGALVDGCYWHKTAEGMEENQTRTETLLDGDWKKSPLSGTDYDVYVVANLHSSSDLSDVQSVADLQDIIERDADIYKVYNETDNPGKLFTMSGKVEGFNPQTVDDEYILPVTLKRVAAKIEIHLSFAPEFAENYAATDVRQRLLNYGTSAPALEGQDGTYVAERASMAEEGSVYQYKGGNEATLVLYTYSTEWEADVMQETFVVVNVPVRNLNPKEGDKPYLGTNYYKIPLRSVADDKRLERNHLYRVNATINMLGNYTPDTPVELKDINYAVQEWKPVYIDINGDTPHYLSVSEEVIIMKDIEDYNEILKFTSSDKVTCTITEAYYYDAEGTKQEVSRQIRNNITVTPDEGLSGFIDIHSPLPTNNGIRYIKFTVSNGYDTKEVLVKQYPLEYITFVDGWFSYRDDFKRYNSQPTTYLYEGDNIVSNGTFTSKVWYNNRICSYEWNWRGNVETSTYDAGTHNNKMYHVVITKTSDQYTLAVPIKDESGDTNDQDPANTNNVSPSFMLASRLGLVSADDYSFAKEHCRNYVETVRDGNTNRVLYTYDDWRLPTKAELMIIDRFQNTEGSVIITILNKSSRRSSAYYWGAGGRYRTNYDGTTTTSDSQWDTTTSGWGAGDAFIRCIRDVKPDEPINSEPEE